MLISSMIISHKSESPFTLRQNFLSSSFLLGFSSLHYRHENLVTRQSILPRQNSTYDKSDFFLKSFLSFSSFRLVNSTMFTSSSQWSELLCSSSSSATKTSLQSSNGTTDQYSHTNHFQENLLAQLDQVRSLRKTKFSTREIHSI